MNEIAIKCGQCNLALCRKFDISIESGRYYAALPGRLPYYGINSENNSVYCLNCSEKIGIIINEIVLLMKSLTTEVLINENDYIKIGRLRFVANN